MSSRLSHRQRRQRRQRLTPPLHFFSQLSPFSLSAPRRFPPSATARTPYNLSFMRQVWLWLVVCVWISVATHGTNAYVQRRRAMQRRLMSYRIRASVATTLLGASVDTVDGACGGGQEKKYSHTSEGFSCKWRGCNWWGTRIYICDDCSSGRYSPNDNDSCHTCGSGRYAANNGKSSCDSCGIGKYKSSETACNDCAAGRYNGQTGQSSNPCAGSCNNGKYSGAAASSCTNCAAGKYSSGNQITTCTACLAGHYQGSAGKTSCTPCAVAHYSHSTATSCTGCPAGKGKKRATKDGCTKCDAGKYSKTGEECKNCPSGKASKDTSAVCSYVCPAGFFCNTGTKYADLEATNCGGYPKYCPEGTAEIISDTNSGRLFTPEPPNAPTSTETVNRFKLRYHNGVKPCPEGYYCKNGVKHVTPPGRWSGSGLGKDEILRDGNACSAGKFCGFGSFNPDGNTIFTNRVVLISYTKVDPNIGYFDHHPWPRGVKITSGTKITEVDGFSSPGLNGNYNC